MNKRIFLIGVLLCSITYAKAQFPVSGYVLDSLTGEKIINAFISQSGSTYFYGDFN